MVGALFKAENVFIGLLSEDRSTLVFPYYVDTHLRSMPARPLSHGLSEYVLREGRPLLARRTDIDALSRQGEVVPRDVGQLATCWLGVPLLVGDEVIGLVSVQSLVEAVVYDAADQALLVFVALQIANTIYRRRTAISRHQANMQLEQRVEERTWELRQQIEQRE